jgi:malate dehydrogenase (oxaloacetate-decarboxylating)(NADP+)
MIDEKAALDYHAGHRPGKIEIKESKPSLSPREMRLAYLPGALAPARRIAADPAASYAYTARGNLIALVTNGTAVPGLGDVGPLAAKPVQEGIAVLFKRLADIDVFDLEFDTRDPDRFVETVRTIAPSFGGINLQDISLPAGLDIYDRLRDALPVPVFHENLYGLAIVVVAAVINAVDLADKRVEDVRLVVSGAGTVGLGCLRLLTVLGIEPANILLYDRDGLVHPGRADLSPHHMAFARDSEHRTLEQGIRDADIFLGASAAGVLTTDMIRSMAARPVVIALAAPEPEIDYHEARAARHDVLVFTSRSGDPNAIVDLLSSPYVFRGALDARASRITEGMMLAAARALAELAREDVPEEVSRAYGNVVFQFGPEYLLPKPVDPRILIWESAAVAEQAVADGVAQRLPETDRYRDTLATRLGTGRELLRQIILEARRLQPRIVLPDGTSRAILGAASILIDEGIGTPILLGNEDEVRGVAAGLGLELRGAAVVDPLTDPRLERFADHLFHQRERRGLIRDVARARLRDPVYFASMMLNVGDADLMVAGMTAPYAESIRRVLEVVGPAPDVRRIFGLYMVLRPNDVFFLADCSVNIEPADETLADMAIMAAQLVRSLGLEPRVAMLAFSDYGSVNHPLARRVRRATEMVMAREPALVVDGEIQLMTALSRDIREQLFPFSRLRQDANILIFPDLQSGHMAVHLLELLGDAVTVGPLLLGTRRPAHVLQYGSTAAAVVNLTALGAVQAGDAIRSGLIATVASGVPQILANEPKGS